MTADPYGHNADDLLVKGKALFHYRSPARSGTVAFCLLAPKPGADAAAAHDAGAVFRVQHRRAQ